MASAQSIDRRRLITGRFGRERDAVLPPWVSKAALASCTGCGDCVEACETSVLKLADGRPEIAPGSGECTFCGGCAGACGAGVFDTARPAFAHRAAIGVGCLAARGVVCQSCRDACPALAIRMAPRIGAPFLPRVGEACTGCGACVGACPVSAISLRIPERADRDA